MRVTSKGQVTIPIALREKFDILPDSEVEFGMRGNVITLKKAKAKNGKPTRGEELVARIRGTGTENLDLTTDQILALMRG